jgi:hypothetical protein
MSYIINLTNGNVFATVQDGTTNTNTGLTLIGRNYTNFGDAQNENFVKLLENFADANPPTISINAPTPLIGTLWYDSNNQIIRVYDGANWYPVSQRINASSAPTADNVGDQWYDTVNQQTRQWNGNTWQIIGPVYSASQGPSGIQVETLNDNSAVPHAVSSDYSGGSLISITSKDSFTLTNQYNGFSSLVSGLNIANSAVVNQSLTVSGTTTFNGITTVNSSLVSQSIAPSTTSTYSLGTSSSQYKDINLSGNVAFTSASISYTTNNLVLNNRAQYGNVDIFVNPAVSIKALSVDGTTGLITVYADPTKSNHISTKNYVDNNIASVNANVNTINSTLTSSITQLRTDTGNYMTANVGSLTSIISTNQNTTNANLTAANTAISALQEYTAVLNNSIQTNATNITNVSNNLIASNVAMTSYVNTLHASSTANINTVNTNLLGSINALAISTNANLVATAANLAPLNSPALTGTPTAPTPTSGDNSTKIATTAYVRNAVANAVTYNVSSNPPSGTPAYTFWFQV